MIISLLDAMVSDILRRNSLIYTVLDYYVGDKFASNLWWK